MISTRYNRLVQALLYLMFISAALHMVILGIHSLMVFTAVDFNFFKIIGLDIFYPDFVASALARKLSFLVGTSVFIGSYFFLAKKQK